MRESILETLIGGAVLAVAGVFLWFALANGGEAASAPEGSVELGARFNSASGIERGTDVRMAGVKVGTVRSIGLDTERAEALVTLAVSRQIVPLEDGTTARIQAEGLLGGNYINLEPASGFGQIEPCPEGEELFGESGCGEILYTQGSVDLLTLMASFANSGGSSNGGDNTSASNASPDAADLPEEGAASDTESPESSATSDDTDSEDAGDGQ